MKDVAPPSRAFSFVLKILRDAVRSLQTKRSSVGTFERLARTIAMLPPFGALVVLLRLRLRFFGPVAVQAALEDGRQFECRPPDLIQLYLWVFDVWEPDLTSFIAARLSPGDTFVDIGANIGYFTTLAALRVGEQGSVIAVEASPSVFERLTNTIESNHLGSLVRLVNKAAGVVEEEISVFAGPQYNIGLTTTALRPGLKSEETVEALPLGRILSPEESRRVRLVKVDVEGAEDGVLEGMAPLLRSFPRDAEIFVELSPEWWSETNKRPIDVLQPFLAAGLNAYEVDNNYWPWRYLWPLDVRRPRRCRRDLTERVKRLDLILSPLDRGEL